MPSVLDLRHGFPKTGKTEPSRRVEHTKHILKPLVHDAVAVVVQVSAFPSIRRRERNFSHDSNRTHAKQRPKHAEKLQSEWERR